MCLLWVGPAPKCRLRNDRAVLLIANLLYSIACMTVRSVQGTVGLNRVLMGDLDRLSVAARPWVCLDAEKESISYGVTGARHCDKALESLSEQVRWHRLGEQKIN